MKEGPDIAKLAALIGDPARANMLTALMSGKALTASELALEAGITLQTASTHVARLADGGLVRERRQGRHKYISLAGEEVASALETLMGLAAGIGHLRSRTGPRDAALRKARVCYNHLAGDMGTRLFDRLVAKERLMIVAEAPKLTATGHAFFCEFGIDIDRLAAARAPLCRACLDWSERRTHLAGSLGRALLERFEALQWARRDPASRAVHFTARGAEDFEKVFG